MFLLCGLGNPGPKYASHRHNVGFMLVDRLASRFGAEGFKDKWKGAYAKTRIGDADAVLLKPLTYMNRSGESVQGAMTFFKVRPENVLVMHDELDLPFGTVRLKRGGGTAGHNGLRSIVEHVGPDFLRLRIGIGRPPPPMRTEDYVLAPFGRDEGSILPDVLADAEASVGDLLSLGLESAMNRLHARPARAVPQKTP